MKRTFFVLLSLFCIAFCLFVLGCSDDDEKVTNPASIDPEDSTFVQDAFDGDIFLEGLQSVDLSLELLNNIPVPLAPKYEQGSRLLIDDDEEIVISSINSYNYSEGWHIFSFDALVVNVVEPDTVWIMGSDSVQVSLEGTAIQNYTPESDFDLLQQRVHAHWRDTPFIGAILASTEEGHIHHRLGIDIEVIAPDTFITANGTVYDTLINHEESMDDVCDMTAILSQTLTNLQMDVTSTDGCPESGTVVVAANLDVECVDYEDPPNTFTLNGNWVVTATVNGNGTITVTFSNGVVSWSITDTCGGPTSTAISRPNMLEFMRSMK